MNKISRAVILLMGAIISLFPTFSGYAFQSNKLLKESLIPTKKSYFNWAGNFGGAFLGGQWGHSKVNTNVGQLTDTSYFSSADNIYSVNQNGSVPLKPKGFNAGFQLGKNWTSTHYIYGLLLDFSSFNLNASNYITDVDYPEFSAKYNIKTTLSSNSLFTARARAGFLPKIHWPFIYFTTGVAVTKLRVTHAFNDNISANWIPTRNGNTRSGLVLGCGLELPLAEKATFFGEYLYNHFGSVSVHSTIDGTGNSIGFISPFTTSINLATNIIRAGLHYRFE